MGIVAAKSKVNKPLAGVGRLGFAADSVRKTLVSGTGIKRYLGTCILTSYNPHAWRGAEQLES